MVACSKYMYLVSRLAKQAWDEWQLNYGYKEFVFLLGDAHEGVDGIVT